MTRIFVHHDYKKLPKATDKTVPVQIYGIEGQKLKKSHAIGSPILHEIKRLGAKLSPQVMDFLSIALGITAADTFVKREEAPDRWTREMTVELPLSDPATWDKVKSSLENALCFLSGDMWKFNFEEGGTEPPEPYPNTREGSVLPLDKRNCVSLLSGGLDSAVGAIDLLSDGYTPLFVSHSYTVDASYQNAVIDLLPGKYSRLSLNAHPRSFNRETDTSMRTRSISFLSFGVIGANAVAISNNLQKVQLIVPENGFISLNAPLTMRRLGSLSTRTTHPHFMGEMQKIFETVGINCDIMNPYQFMTKGETLISCKNQDLLKKIIDSSLSCGHSKRIHQQCGQCVPCIVRRAAIHKAGLREKNKYKYMQLKSILSDPDRGDDLRALVFAIKQSETRKIGPWILDSGPLPPNDYQKYQAVFVRSLEEIKAFLEAEKVM